MANQNCIIQSCLENCCNKLGYCIDYTSFNPSTNSCYYYYSGSASTFPFYIIPIIVVTAFFLIISLVFLFLCCRKRKASQDVQLTPANPETNNQIYMEGYMQDVVYK